MKTTIDTVAALAAAFTVGLQNVLDAQTLAAIDAENVFRGDDSCASHDHLDANEVMEDAFMAVMGRASKASSSADAELINAAWNRAKAAGFATHVGGGPPMKSHTDAPRLRARLTRLVSMGFAPTGRAREIRRLAERITRATGDDVGDVLDQACRDAIAQLLGEDAP